MPHYHATMSCGHKIAFDVDLDMEASAAVLGAQPAAEVPCPECSGALRLSLTLSKISDTQGRCVDCVTPDIVGLGPSSAEFTGELVPSCEAQEIRAGAFYLLGLYGILAWLEQCGVPAPTHGITAEHDGVRLGRRAVCDAHYEALKEQMG